MCEKSSEPDETDLAFAQAGAIGGALLLVTILVMGLAVISFVPISPEITAYVQVSTTSDGRPTITLLSIGYQKVTVAAAAGEPKDRVQILQVAATTASAVALVPPSGYNLTVTVVYLGQIILEGKMTSVKDGFYLIKASFWPRSEQPNIPYTMYIVVWQGAYYVQIVSNLLPS